MTDQKEDAKPLVKKLEKLRDLRLESDKDLMEVLKGAGDFLGQNTLRNRQNLRSEIELRGIDYHVQFLDNLGGVKGSLDSVKLQVNDMLTKLDAMSHKLQLAKQDTHGLLQTAANLKKQQQDCEDHEKELANFIERYQLPDADVKVLKSDFLGQKTNLPERFFEALARVKSTHSNCKELLRGGSQRTGLEVMEQMSHLEQQAYENLYRWCQRECRSFTVDTTEFPAALCRALRLLQSRPVLFQYCLDEYATGRKLVLAQNFIDALTKGSTLESTKPIALHSYDSGRYLNDMLAWVHQGAASEYQLLQTLIKVTDDEERRAAVETAFSAIVDGLCTPLKSRIEQLIVLEKECLTFYQMKNLLTFYLDTLAGIVPSQSLLLLSLLELQVLAEKSFISSLHLQLADCADSLEVDADRLGIPASLRAISNLLHELLSCKSAGVLPLEKRQLDFASVLDMTVRPVLAACVSASQDLSERARLVFLLNCLYQLNNVLALHEFTSEYVAQLRAEMDDLTAKLVMEQTEAVLRYVNLWNLYNMILQETYQVSLSAMDGYDVNSLRLLLANFDKYLSQPESEKLTEMSRLMSAQVRGHVCREAARHVAEAYERVYTALLEPQHEYDLVELALKTPEQVAKLLC